MSDMDDQKEVEDILANLSNKKKRINSSRKGKKAERDICEALSERFHLPFARKPDEWGSGGWSTSHQDLQEGLDLEHMAGDLITPKGFAFSIENKKGYDLEFLNLFPGSRRKKDTSTLDGFIEQAERDSGRVGKNPCIIYTKDYCPSIVFIKEIENIPTGITKLNYKSYIGISLFDFLSLPDRFFFRASTN